MPDMRLTLANQFLHLKEISASLKLSRIVFSGLEVVVGVRDTDAYIYKLGFQVTLLGNIVLMEP